MLGQSGKRRRRGFGGYKKRPGFWLGALGWVKMFLPAKKLREAFPIFLTRLPIWIGGACGGDKDAVGLRIRG
jgi:hypothetical protein